LPCINRPHAAMVPRSVSCGSGEAQKRTSTGAASLVCTENLNPDVMVMKAAKDRV
jgi:hypothetical protein